VTRATKIELTATDSGVSAGGNLTTRYYVSANGADASNPGSYETYNPVSGISLLTQASGTWYVYFYSIDAVGNIEGAQRLAVKLDAETPHSTITPVSGTPLKADTLVSLVAEDGGTVETSSGLKDMYYRIDGDVADPAGYKSYGGAFTLASLADGPHTVSYYATDYAGNVETLKTASFLLDTIAPQGTITIQENSFTTFLNEATFGLFFKQNIDVAISAEDGENGSGVEEIGKDGKGGGIAYVKSQTSYLSVNALVDANLTWTSGSSFGLTPEERDAFFIYARVTDRAGNTSYVRSDGVVMYEDSEQATKQIQYTKLSSEPVKATVILNDNTIAGVKNTTGDAAANLVETRDYSVSGGEITFFASYLDELEAGSYTLEISYRPLGKDFAQNPAGTNDAPATTSLALEVVKVTSTVTLSVDPAKDAFYGRQMTLVATVADAGELPTGTVQFFEGTTTLGDPVVLNGGIARLPWPFDAGTHTDLKAVYSGDTNYVQANSNVLASFEVAKAEQPALSVSGHGVASGAAGFEVTKPREDGTLALTVSGGAGTGSYENGATYKWVVGDEFPAGSTEPGEKGSVITIDADTTGTVLTINFVAAGSVTLSVARAESDNYLESTPASVTLVITEETTSPVPGGSVDPAVATITAGEPSLSSVELSWTAAQDNLSARAELLYYVYRSTSKASDIETVEDCETYGTLLNGGGSRALTSYRAINLLPDTAYWFNVVVADKAGNRAAYTPVHVVTPLEVGFTAEQVGGITGKTKSTGILVTFDHEVTAFTEASVQLAGSAQRAGAVTDNGDKDARTWFIPINVTGENGTGAILTLSTWENAESGHKYIVTAGVEAPNPRTITVFVPVPQKTPEASIDFVEGRLVGLVPSGTYTFDGPEATAFTDGSYPIPSNWYGTEIHIIHKGGSATVDSEEQALPIPLPPAAPAAGSFTVIQPTEETRTGALSGVADGLEYSSSSLHVTYLPIEDGGVSELAPGQYYLRVAAVEGESFASATTPFFIHAFDSVSFEDELEGYAVPDAIEIGTDEGAEIAKVAWFDSPNAAKHFTLTGNVDDGWRVVPAENLERGTYFAKIAITHTGGQVSYRDVSFTVHPKLEFASASRPGGESNTATTGLIASDEDGNGITDTLTIHLVYPAALNYNYVLLLTEGAAQKAEDATGFSYVSEDMRTYQLAVTPTLEAKSGDNARMRIRLDSDAFGDDRYALQIARQEDPETGQADTNVWASAPVAVYRAISTASAVTVLNGYATGYVQFTLDKSGYPIVPEALEVSAEKVAAEGYAGPVVLGGSAEAEIAFIARVSVDEGYTYRVFLAVSAGGTLSIELPKYGIEAYELTEDVVGGSSLTGVAYFLDAEGFNYLTDLAAFQTLPARETDGYVAPALTLPTSLEYSDGVTARVWIDGVELDEGSYSVDGAGSARFIFSDDPANPVELDDQLTLTIAKDWTRVDATYKLVVLINGPGIAQNTVAQAKVTVRGITPTYRVTAKGDPAAGASGDGTGRVEGASGTGDGRFEAGSMVTVTAAPALTGWRFDSWVQLEGAKVDPFPTSESFTLKMPAQSVAFGAVYVDGVAPQTTITPADGTWTRTGEVTLAAIDHDVTAGDVGESGGTRGTAYLYYRLDGAEKVIEVPTSETSFTLPVDGRHIIEYWAVDSAGNEEAHHTATINFDSTAPSATIILNGVSYSKFTSPTGHMRFYRGDLGITITGSDAGVEAGADGSGEADGSAETGSGVAKLEYLVDDGTGHTSEVPLFVDEEAAALSRDPRWTEVSDPSAGITVSLTENGRYFVFVRVSDVAGNVSVVHTDGFVRYHNSESSAPAFSYTRHSGLSATSTVATHGNTVAGITNGTATLSTPAGYTVSSEAGTTVITLTPAYLQGLDIAGSPYLLTVSYAPQGITYQPVEGNAVPATTSIVLNIEQAASSVSLSARSATGAGNAGNAGNAGSTELVATVTGTAGYLPTGSIEFFDGGTSLGVISVKAAAGNAGVNGIGEAVQVVTLSAGTHDLSAVYSGDVDYEGAFDVLSSYSVDFTDQQAPSIAGENIANGTLAKTYGDTAFSLVAAGENGTNRAVWTSSNPTVATVDDESGEVTIVGVGTTAITVKWAGSHDYNESPSSAPLILTVAPRVLVIEGLGAADRVYDGTAVAEITGTPSLAGIVDGDEVLVSGGSALFDSANAGKARTVTFSGFVLSGADVANYELLGQPLSVTASIAPATPVWEGGAPQAPAIAFGQRLSACDLSGVAVKGIDGRVLSGTVSWAPGVDVSVMPGASDTVLTADGYPFAVRFVPAEGSLDALNYTSLDGEAAVSVAKATPRMAGGDSARPVGSVIFTMDAQDTNSLADSALTGEVVYSFDGVPTAIEGIWEWDNARNGQPSSNALYTVPGSYTAFARFVPGDARVAILEGIEATFGVFSLRTQVTGLPEIGSAVYGQTVGGASIAGSGAVVAVGPTVDGMPSSELPIDGSWSWKNPGMRVTSVNGTQRAVLVFTPNNEVDWDRPSAGGYAPVEREVNLVVSPASLMPKPPVSPAPVPTPAPVITFGDALFAVEGFVADGSAFAGYTFSGVTDFGDVEVPGSFVLAEDSASVVPGSTGYETSVDGNGTSWSVRDDGVYFATVIFEPEASYAGRYAPLPLLLKLKVAAGTQTTSELSDAFDDADMVTLPAA
jgi:hypothetical protein